jgi:hypothetical protein
MMTLTATDFAPIVEDPDADGPRLTLARRLETSTDPIDKARAEFIRMQIEAELPDVDGNRWVSLVRTSRDLLARHRVTWEKPLRTLRRPTLANPIRWLNSRIFGSGGTYGFRRGFVENLLTSVDRYFEEDAGLFGHAPLRSLLLTHASEAVAALYQDRDLQTVESLHLVGSMELDEDLSRLADQAKQVGLTVLEMHYPRLDETHEPLLAMLRATSDDSVERPSRPEDYIPWAAATPEARQQLIAAAIRKRTRLLLNEHDPADEGELLALTDRIYLGPDLRKRGVWGVAKAHQDLDVQPETGRRLLLVRPDGDLEGFRTSAYFRGEVA